MSETPFRPIEGDVTAPQVAEFVSVAGEWLQARSWSSAAVEAFQEDGGTYQRVVTIEVEGVWNRSGGTPGAARVMMSPADAVVFVAACARAPLFVLDKFPDEGGGITAKLAMEGFIGAMHLADYFKSRLDDLGVS